MIRVREWIIANLLIIVAAFALVMSVAAIVQTIRIDGFRLDLPLLPAFGPKGLKAANADLQVRLDLMQAQRDAAEAIARAVATANSQATERANTDVERQMESERARTDSFIAAGGVRRQACPGTNPAPSGDSAGIDGNAGALPKLDDLPHLTADVVTVLPEDVRICTENTVKARAWREWGLAIEANHQQPPSSGSAATGQ